MKNQRSSTSPTHRFRRQGASRKRATPQYASARPKHISATAKPGVRKNASPRHTSHNASGRQFIASLRQSTVIALVALASLALFHDSTLGQGRFGDVNVSPPTSDASVEVDTRFGAASDQASADPSAATPTDSEAQGASTAASSGSTDASSGDTSSSDANSSIAPNPTPVEATNSGSSFIGVILAAGPMMFAILGCSIVLVMFIFERAISLRKSRVIPKHFVNLFLNELDGAQLKPEEALDLCEQSHSPISEVFAAAVRKWNRPSVEVEQGVLDAGERVANGLRKYLRLFNGIATISPLLGLLGTVLGMIRAFNAIASSDAMGKPELLAEGISQALLTTAGGLSVAIPAFIAYMYFTGRVDRLIIEIDELGQEVVTAIASDAWKAQTSKKSKPAAKAA